MFKKHKIEITCMLCGGEISVCINDDGNWADFKIVDLVKCFLSAFNANDVTQMEWLEANRKAFNKAIELLKNPLIGDLYDQKDIHNRD